MHHPVRTLVLVASLGLALLLFASPATLSQEVQPGERIAPEEALAELSWLAGTWSGEMWGGEFVAYYSTPAGGKILSHSRLLKGATEAFYEFEVFETHEEVVHLRPFPGGRRAQGFTMKSRDPVARKVVFENPEKDYPTRITYHRVADDNLVITLSDPHGDSDKEEKFDLKRVEAEAAGEK